MSAPYRTKPLSLGQAMRDARESAGLTLAALGERVATEGASHGGHWAATRWAYWYGEAEQDAAGVGPADLARVERDYPMTPALRAALDDRYAAWGTPPPDVAAVADNPAYWPRIRALALAELPEATVFLEPDEEAF